MIEVLKNWKLSEFSGKIGYLDFLPLDFVLSRKRICELNFFSFFYISPVRFLLGIGPQVVKSTKNKKLVN